MGGRDHPEVLIESLRAIDGVDLYDLLGQVRVPTLALHGTERQDRPVFATRRRWWRPFPEPVSSLSIGAATGSSAATR